MLKNISVLALMAVSAFITPASAIAADYTPEIKPKISTNLIERFTNSYTLPVTADPTVKLNFVKTQVTSIAAPKPEPKPEATPKKEGTSPQTAAESSTSTNTRTTTESAKISPEQQTTASKQPSTSVAPPTQKAVPVSPGSAQAEAAKQMEAYGWGADQLTCLISLWQKESNWNSTASNPSSGAYGIPQSLPGSKMASAGADWQTNPATQIKWGLGYIAERYKTPCGAWGHSVSVGWY